MALRIVRQPFETDPSKRAFHQSLRERLSAEDAQPDSERRLIAGVRINTATSARLRIPTFLGRRIRGWQVTTQDAPGTFHEVARDMRTVTIQYNPPAGVTRVNFGVRIW